MEFFDLMHNATMILAFSIWLIFLGGFLIVTYFFADKNKFLGAVAIFFVSFSVIKRTKTILLSYATLLILVGLFGCLFFVSSP